MLNEDFKTIAVNITPELIPHVDFHKGIWLLPVKRSGWYYFMKKQNRNHITSRTFIQTVDTPLRELVKLLHEKGIRTTPSCAGHHLSERNLEKIYDDLEKDANEIRGAGLKLRDVETGIGYLFKDKNYSLPWRRQAFVQKTIEYQLNGILGIRPGHHKKLKREILKLNIANADINERDSILFIYTSPNGNDDCRHVWTEVTHAVKNILN